MSWTRNSLHPPKQVLIIALHGQAYSGKDTAAQILRAAAVPGVEISQTRFADPIYSMIRTLVPFAHSGMSKEDKERSRTALGGLSVRQMAIAIGEGARKYRDDSWVLIAQRAIMEIARPDLSMAPHLILVPDLRKEAECEMLTQMHGRVWRPARDEQGVAKTVEFNTLIVHIDAVGGVKTDQYNAATETPLKGTYRSLDVLNDQRRGLADYAERLMAEIFRFDFTLAGEFFHHQIDCHRLAEQAQAESSKVARIWKHAEEISNPSART